MTDRRDVRKSFDLALRIGEMLLVSGAAATDAAATMEAVTRACGLQNVSADVTFIDLTLRHQPNNEEPVAVHIRRVTRRPVNYAELIEVDTVVHNLVSGALTRDEARDEVARILSSGRHRRRWAVTLGWGVMGTGVALTVGGNPVVCLLAFLAAVAIDRTRVLLPLARIPPFYQQAAGGFVATLIAVIAAATRLEVNPSRVVTAGIVMLLAGVGITGATQDALTGFPVTATAITNLTPRGGGSQSGSLLTPPGLSCRTAKGGQRSRRMPGPSSRHRSSRRQRRCTSAVRASHS